MSGLILCVVAFVACFIAGRRATWFGFVLTMTVGYAYGIVRANLPTTFSHFMFDAGVVGYYLALMTRRYTPVQRFRMRRVMPWVLVLVAWPTVLLLLPLQNPLIQLVGWRGQIFFLPFILIGAMLDGSDMRRISMALAVFSLIELGFTIGEVRLGVPWFYPMNEVDQIIYNSADVMIGAKSATFRLPGTFVQAATFGGVMAATIPFLLGALVQEWRLNWRRNLLLGALGASAICVFLSASRSQALLLIVIVLGATFSGQVKNFPWFGWVAMIAVVGWLVATSPRMQRFFLLQDTTYIKNRVSHSVNKRFLDLALDYPLGNGLGGGGTSMPYFLQNQLRNPVAIENEYGRIMLEQGLPGLAMWLGFIVWALSRPMPREGDPWYLGKLLARIVLGFAFLAAQTGMGLLTSIPGTAILLLSMGWIAAPVLLPAPNAGAQRRTPASSAAALRSA